MSLLTPLLAPAARHALWHTRAFPGRWRVQRWAEQHGAAYRDKPARNIELGDFEFLVDSRASLDVYLNGITPNSAIEQILRHFVKPGTTVLDVGANIGWTARLMSTLVGPTGHVHAFEPIDTAYTNLLRNAAATPHRNITAHQLAASDEAGRIELYLDSGDAAALATMRKPDAGAKAAAQVVQTVTLDSLQARLGPVAFAKIDVEGAEHKVLLGMQMIIERGHPTLAIELSDAWLRKLGSSGQALLAFVQGHGYRVLAFDRGQFTPLTHAPAEQVDVVCIADV